LLRLPLLAREYLEQIGKSLADLQVLRFMIAPAGAACHEGPLARPFMLYFSFVLSSNFTA